MRYIHFSIITLITGIIMHITMYFVPFESRKMPLFMTIIFYNLKAVKTHNITKNINKSLLNDKGMSIGEFTQKV
ncbi:Doubtful CDS. No database matches [Staphylococcus aureus]|nr:Doubtful CDS. No database matches [Staphylococcus aureus]